jgi:hypothetical protein
MHPQLLVYVWGSMAHGSCDLGLGCSFTRQCGLTMAAAVGCARHVCGPWSGVAAGVLAGHDLGPIGRDRSWMFVSTGGVGGWSDGEVLVGWSSWACALTAFYRLRARGPDLGPTRALRAMASTHHMSALVRHLSWWWSRPTSVGSWKFGQQRDGAVRDEAVGGCRHPRRCHR